MKKMFILFMLALTVSTQACHGQNRYVEPVKGPFTKNDTLFFYRQLYVVDHDTCVSACYLERNRSSESYKRYMNAFELDLKRGKNAYEFYYKSLKKIYPKPFVKHDLRGLPQEWLPLNSYKKQYYLDGMSYGFKLFSDSLFIENFMDGPLPHVIKSIERKSDSMYVITCLPGKEDKGNYVLTIHLINKAKGIAVWKEQKLNTDNKPSYRLMVTKEGATGFDLIDYITFEEVEGLTYDNIDYEALIKEKSNH
ncbi:MAG: hypothetical protein PHI48_10405 [Bacteroidales bacterium]|nr:hypothetical protein [Bacteroidales bacterium]